MRLIGIAAAAFAAFAATPTTAASDPCRAVSVRTEVDMSACRAEERRAADSALNAVYRRLLTSFRADGADHVRALVAAQRSWIGFRDTECVVRTWDSRHGTAFQVYADACVTELTRQRASALQAMVNAP